MSFVPMKKGTIVKEEEEKKEEEEEVDIPNPRNLPIMEIKILVAGIDKCGQNKIVEMYGAVEGELTD
jgi:hypothetical protein